MTTYGVTSAGFVSKPLTEILTDIEDRQHSTISESLDVSATEPIGQINGIFADHIRQLWEVAEATYKSRYPDSASGDALDGVAAINAVSRVGASSSTVTVGLYLTNGTTVPINSQVQIGSDGEIWQTTAEVTNSTGYPATVDVEVESVNTGPIQGLTNTIDTIIPSISGWDSKASVENTNNETYNFSITRDLDIWVDGVADNISFVTGDFSTPSAATAAEVAAVIDSDLTGGSCVAVGTKIRISSDTDGPDSSIQVTGGLAYDTLGFDGTLIKGFNRLDAELGSDIQTDPQFRNYRLEVLRRPGAGTMASILANVRAVDGVLQASIKENVFSVEDQAFGIPPHSFEVMALGGDDSEIATAIFEKKDAGIQAHGDTSETVADSEGSNHTIKFTRPAEQNVYISLTAVVDNSLFPSDGASQIKVAIATDYQNTLSIGWDIIKSDVIAYAKSIPGVVDVQNYLAGYTQPATVDGNLTIGFESIAEMNTTWITVSVVDGSKAGND